MQVQVSDRPTRCRPVSPGKCDEKRMTFVTSRLTPAITSIARRQWVWTNILVTGNSSRSIYAKHF